MLGRDDGDPRSGESMGHDKTARKPLKSAEGLALRRF
jgi:hypothetical protein